MLENAHSITMNRILTASTRRLPRLQARTAPGQRWLCPHRSDAAFSPKALGVGSCWSRAASGSFWGTAEKRSEEASAPKTATKPYYVTTPIFYVNAGKIRCAAGHSAGQTC